MRRLTRLLVIFGLVMATVGLFAITNAAAAGGVQPAGTPAGQPVDLEGRLEIIHSDDFAGNKSDIRYNFTTDQGEQLELQFDDPYPATPRTDRVRVRGVRDGNVVQVNGGGVSAAANSTVQAPTTGAKKVLVLLFNFADNRTEPYTPAAANGVLFTNANSVAAYYAENSWNQSTGASTLTLSGDIAGDNVGGVITPRWFQIANTSASCTYTSWASAADSAATAAGMNLANYNYKVYAFPNTGSCGWSGLAYLPGTKSFINGGNGTATGVNGMSLRVVSHELGHNFNSHHSSTISCSLNAVRVPLVSAISSCAFSEYGDPFTVMGSSSKRHHTNFSMANLGWPLNTQDITATGTYTLTQDESYGVGFQALRILRASGQYLVMELRQPVGGQFDNFTTTDPAVTGVSLRVTPGYSTLTQSKLVDTTSGTTGFSDGPLPVGKPVYDPLAQLTIKTVSVAAGVAQVEVTFGPDTNIPTAATGLTATAASLTTINLSWTAGADNIGVAGYRVLRNGVAVGGTAATSYTDTGLAPSTLYSYTVETFDYAGNLAPSSNTATATTTGDTTPPSTPTNLVATTIDLASIGLTWTASTDNASVAGYYVFRDGTQVGTAVTNAYTDSGLGAATTYTYAVQAFDSSGNVSGLSNSASATTAGSDLLPPSTPTLLTAAATDSTHVSLTWSASTDNVGVAGYEVFRGGVSLGTSVATNYVDGTVTAGNTYSYQVRAFDAVPNYSALSNALSATTPSPDITPPTAPTNLKAKVTPGKNTKVSLTWTASTDNVGVASYVVYRNGVQIGTVSGSTRSYSQPLPSTYNYTYYVVAKDAAGNTSPSSNSVTIVK